MLPILLFFFSIFISRRASLRGLAAEPVRILVPLYWLRLLGIICPSERVWPVTWSSGAVVGAGSCGRSGAPGTGEMVDWACAEVAARLISAKAARATNFFMELKG